MKLKRFNSEADRKFQMDEMRSFDEPQPSVGIFWYDPKDDELFGVHTKEVTQKDIEDADKSKAGIINYGKLHKNIWNKEFYKARANHEDTKFKGDYTKIPRGRVRWNKDRFEVMIGKWYKDYEPRITELIKSAFSLDDFDYIYDEHWDLGHGWSGDHLH